METLTKEIVDVLSDLRSNSTISSFDESATKQVVILRILGTLGWNQYDYDEVRPEYAVGGGKVDYALRTDGSNKVFIEAKRANESLEHHQRQLLEYSFQHGVKLAALTNGMIWWLYLPLREENWEDRRFWSVDIREQDVSEVGSWFVEFLNKENVHSGAAAESAERRLDSLRNDRVIHETLPKAWEDLITDKDDLLVDLIDEKVESLCGLKPGSDVIRRFLDKRAESMSSRALLPKSTT